MRLERREETKREGYMDRERERDRERQRETEKLKHFFTFTVLSAQGWFAYAETELSHAYKSTCPRIATALTTTTSKKLSSAREKILLS